jgi:hypothetical protein
VHACQHTDADQLVWVAVQSGQRRDVTVIWESVSYLQAAPAAVDTFNCNCVTMMLTTTSLHPDGEL